MGDHPFPDSPPRYFRVQLYLYTFNKPTDKQTTGAWWKRTLLEEYTVEGSL